MARTRLLNPGFFKNETLAELPAVMRLLFQGLWTIADREGRLEDRPRRIKVDVLPWDDVDIDQALSMLEARGFIQRYTVEGRRFIQVVNFLKHQNPHHRETESMIPPNTEQIEASRSTAHASAILQSSTDEASPNQVASCPPVSVSVSVSDPVRVSDDGASAPVSLGRRSRMATVFDGALPKDHLDHVCSPNLAWCVPNQVHLKLAVRLAPKYGGDTEQAKAALVLWYASVWATLPADTVIGDAFKFWTPRFEAQFGNTQAPHIARPGEPRSAVPGADATRDYMRRLKELAE